MKTTTKEVTVKKTVYTPEVRSIEDFFTDITFDTAEECRAYEDKWLGENEAIASEWAAEAERDGRIMTRDYVIGSDLEYLELAYIRDKNDLAKWVTFLRSVGNFVDDWAVRNALANHDLPCTLAVTFNECGGIYTFDDAVEMYRNLGEVQTAVGDFIGKNDPAYQRIKCKSRDIYMVRDIEQIHYQVFEKFEDARDFMADWLDGTVEKWETERIRSFKCWDEVYFDYSKNNFLGDIGDRTGCYIDTVTYQS